MAKSVPYNTLKGKMPNFNHIVELKNISKRFGGTQALKNVSCEFKKGEIHGVIGQNGVGERISL